MWRAEVDAERHVVDEVVDQLAALGAPEPTVRMRRLELGALCDRLAAVQEQLRLSDAVLALCETNLRDARARAEAGHAESSRLQVELEQLRGQLVEARATVERLTPFEVSARCQLRALRRTLPAAVGKRLSGSGLPEVRP